MKYVMIVLCLCCLCGCYTAFNVQEKGGGNIDGIPFYLMRGGINQQTIWMEPYYNLSISIDTLQEKKGPDAWKSVFVGDKDISYLTFQKNKNILKNQAYQSSNQIDHYQKLIDQFSILVGYDPVYDKPDTSILIENELSPAKYVDYEHPYYLNARRPWIGTSELTVELNPDGTLSKGTSHIESKTAETILGAVTANLPIKEYLTSKWIPSKTGGSPGALNMENFIPKKQPALPKARITMVAESRQVTHVLSKLWPNETNPDALAPITKDKMGAVGYTYKRIINVDKGNDGGEKGDEKSIDVSGKIVLPKEKE